MQAQIIVAFLMTLLALGIFYLLAQRILENQVSALTCTALLAYAPGVALNSSISSPSITDLVSSSVAGYLAFLDPRRRKWRSLSVWRRLDCWRVSTRAISRCLLHWLLPRLSAIGVMPGAQSVPARFSEPLRSSPGMFPWPIAWVVGGFFPG